MIIGSISENKDKEKRISITPEISKKYIASGFEVIIENNIGDHLGIDDSDFINKINECEIQIQAMEFVELRIFSALSAGQRVGPESSILKTRGTEIGQYLQELAVEAIGYWSQPFVEDTFANVNEPSIGPVSYTHLTLPTTVIV